MSKRGRGTGRGVKKEDEIETGKKKKREKNVKVGRIKIILNNKIKRRNTGIRGRGRWIKEEDEIETEKKERRNMKIGRVKKKIKW